MPELTMSVNDVRNRISKLHIEFINGEATFVLPNKKLTVARYFTRELKLQECGWKDNQIRDLAEEFINELKPPKIVKCETPEDYTEMFKASTNTSCMAIGGGSYRYLSKDNKIASGILKEHNLWTSVWYHYNPHYQGYYAVSQKGEPIARIGILDDKHQGVTNGKNQVAIQYIKDHFSKLGYGNREWITITKTFRIPGIKWDGKLWCPVPHCDDFNKPLFFGFDKKTNEFVCGPGQPFKINFTYEFPGYVHNEQVLAAK